MKNLQKMNNLALRAVVPAALTLALACPAHLFSQATAENHIVSSQALQQQMVTSSATRQQNIDTVTSFLASPTAERAMRNAIIDPVQVRTAIPTLSDQELASLSARAADTQQKFAAGLLGTTTLLLIIVIVAVIIIVAAIH
jgi:hypothetical protein